MDQVATLPLPTTPEEFLAWEVLQEEKYEFDGQAPVPMNGGTREHAIIETNIIGELRQHFWGSPCRVYAATMKIAVGLAFRYPDASVSCTPVPAGSVTVPVPVILFEVVSPSSHTLDHVVKLREYQSLPSVRRYVILDQHEMAATVHSRREARWSKETLGSGDTLPMPEIGCFLPLAAFYAGVFDQA